jgi:CHAT domain-containing protein/tetratricopeptide (TPR) repeat protein
MKILAFVRVCLFSLLIILPIIAQSEDDVACREIVKTFYVAYQSKDATKLTQFWKTDSKYLTDFQTETNKFFTENQSIAIKDLEFGRTYFKDEVFRLRIKISINEKLQNPTFQFVKENNQWKIWRLTASEFDLVDQLRRSNDEKYYERLVSENAELQNSLLCGWINSTLSSVFEDRNFDRAYNMSEIGLNSAKKANDNDCYGKMLLRRAETIAKKGNSTEANKEYFRILELAKQNNDAKLESQAIYNVGLIYQGLGNKELAIEYYSKALALAKKIGYTELEHQLINYLAHFKENPQDRMADYKYLLELKKGDTYAEARLIANIAAEYSEIDNNEKAIDLMGISIRKFQETGAKRELVTAFNMMSECYFNSGNTKGGLVWLEKAYRLSQHLQIFNGTTITLLYSVNRKLGKLIEAKKYAIEGVLFAENSRMQVLTDEMSQSRLLKSNAPLYEGVIIIQSELGEIEEALNSSELFKSRVLYDVMRTGKSNLSQAMSASELEQQAKLKQAINEANRQLTREQQKDYQNKTRITELENNLKQSRFALEEFQLKLYATKPELKIQRGEFQPINLVEIAKLFPDEKSAILEFAVTNERSFLYAITKENGKLNLQIYPIDLNKSDLAKKTESFRQKLQDKNLNYQTDARELYRLLLGKAEAQLKGKDSLIIVPDSFLWEVPFQALMPSENRFLIQDSAINYVPSLTVLREMNKTNRVLSKSPKLLAFGNPELNSTIKAKVEKEVRGGKLESLPSAEKEVDYLGKLYGSKNSKILKNSFATETFFKAEASKFNILHFATHGILNNQNPMYSSLVLSLANETNGANDTKEDGLLEAWELMDSKLNADLAILSACETGRGEASSGEGIVGLSWAFFIAGTPRIVATQWKVESESTSKIMQNFHKNLRKSSNISKSLQKSMLAQLKNPTTRHPFYWAGFVFIGKI